MRTVLFPTSGSTDSEISVSSHIARKSKRRYTTDTSAVLPEVSSSGDLHAQEGAEDTTQTPALSEGNSFNANLLNINEPGHVFNLCQAPLSVYVGCHPPVVLLSYLPLSIFPAKPFGVNQTRKCNL